MVTAPPLCAACANAPSLLLNQKKHHRALLDTYKLSWYNRSCRKVQIWSQTFFSRSQLLRADPTQQHPLITPRNMGLPHNSPIQEPEYRAPLNPAQVSAISARNCHILGAQALHTASQLYKTNMDKKVKIFWYDTTHQQQTLSYVYKYTDYQQTQIVRHL